jgi:hypothetical protein
VRARPSRHAPHLDLLAVLLLAQQFFQRLL